MVAEAKAGLAAEAESARKALETEAGSLAGEIASVILERRAS